MRRSLVKKSGLVKSVKIASQIVGVSKICDQNGDRVSKNVKSCHICSMRLKRLLTENKKNMELCLYVTYEVISLHECTELQNKFAEKFPFPWIFL